MLHNWLPWWLCKEFTCQCRRHGFDLWDRKITEKEMATPLQYSCLVNLMDLEIPWTEEPGRLQSMGSQRVRHEWALHGYMYNILFLNWGRMRSLGFGEIRLREEEKWRESLFVHCSSHYEWSLLFLPFPVLNYTQLDGNSLLIHFCMISVYNVACIQQR